MLALEGSDPADRRLLSDVVKRVGKALRAMKGSGHVEQAYGLRDVVV